MICLASVSFKRIPNYSNCFLYVFRGLDLTDAGTAFLLQPAIAAISHYINAFERRCVVTIAEAGKQWKLLDELVRTAGLPSAGQCEVKHAPQIAPALLDTSSHSRADNPNCTHKSTAGGIYEPNNRVKSLPNVFRRLQVVELHCKRCSLKLVSSWVAIMNGQEKVMRPTMGHRRCKSPYISLEGRACVNDGVSELDLCEHKTYRKHCRVCRPAAFCIHNRRKYDCKLCRAAGHVHTRGCHRNGAIAAKKQCCADSSSC